MPNIPLHKLIDQFVCTPRSHHLSCHQLCRACRYSQDSAYAKLPPSTLSLLTM